MVDWLVTIAVAVAFVLTFEGAVPRSSLIGPVMVTYWPPGRVSLR